MQQSPTVAKMNKFFATTKFTANLNRPPGPWPLINIAIFLAQLLFFGPVSQFGEPIFICKIFATINLKHASWALAPEYSSNLLRRYVHIWSSIFTSVTGFFLTNYSGPTSQLEKQINMMLKFWYRGDRTHDLKVGA